MLNNYLTATQNLLQNPGAPSSLFTSANLTIYINTARGQLAGEAECIRYPGTINTVFGQRSYSFSSISTVAVGGIQGVLNVRSIKYALGTGFQWINVQAWEWFDFLYMNNPAPAEGPPQSWSQYGQGASSQNIGASATGSFYVDPLPDGAYTLTCDCVCFPIPLVDDTTAEVIPYLFTDAVPYFAAYLALMSAQTNTRTEQAKGMLQLYKMFVTRARQAANSAVDRFLYEQADDPAQGAAYGQTQQSAQ